MCPGQAGADDASGPDRHPCPEPGGPAVCRQWPKLLWVGDITSVATTEGWLYVATLVDVWSRKVAGWAMADHLRVDLVLAALQMALQHRQPDGPQ